MERGLCEPALPVMEFSFAGEQAVSEEASRSLESTALVKVFLIGDEHVTDQVRMAEQVDVLRTYAPVRDVTMLALHRHHHGERIACNLNQELPWIARHRSRWSAAAWSCLESRKTHGRG